MRLDLSRRSNGELLREFSALVENDRRGTAELLARVGEIQARRLYRDPGCPTMYACCVGVLHMSEDVAWKRTRVAALARRFPVILDMVAEGRLHLTAVVHLLPHRNAPDFVQLLEAAAHRTKSEIELLLAERFPRPGAPTVVRPLAMSGPCQAMAPEPDVPTRIPMAAPGAGCNNEEGAAMSPEAASLNGGGSPGAPDASLAHEPAIPARPHSTPERLAPGRRDRGAGRDPGATRPGAAPSPRSASRSRVHRPGGPPCGNRPLHGNSRPSASPARASWSEGAGK